jgi:hypothetical protein
MVGRQEVDHRIRLARDSTESGSFEPFTRLDECISDLSTGEKRQCGATANRAENVMAVIALVAFHFITPTGT